MKLKVCGLSNPLEVKTCVSINVEYCGFILNYPKSHRFISLDKAKNLTEIHKENSNFVGVLVKPTEEELANFSKLFQGSSSPFSSASIISLTMITPTNLLSLSKRGNLEC